MITRAEMDTAATIVAFALVLFVAFQRDQPWSPLLELTGAAGAFCGALGVTAWRRWALLGMTTAFFVAGYAAIACRSAYDHFYARFSAGEDATWMPILFVFYGIPAGVVFLCACAATLLIRNLLLRIMCSG